MNTRERYLETALFGTPDRIPLTPGGGRKSTIERWIKDGMPEGVDAAAQACLEAGVDVSDKGNMNLSPRIGFSVNERMIPEFEEKVIERKERSQVVQDWKGNICEISNDYTIEYLRNAMDFVTRRWIKCPVENHSDWEDMKKRYDVEALTRVSGDGVGDSEALRNRHWPISGPYWQLREWLGFEQLCVLFYDDPAFAEEMIEFWQEYVARLLERTFEHCIPDCVHLSEDMAYKAHPMLSPEMTCKYLLPCWKHWGEIIRGAGVPVYAMDSDGYIEDLIPIWMEAGINQCDPIEVAAGNDLVRFRERFGKQMAYSGGVDKRAIAAGGEVLRGEIDRLRPVIEDGGYQPGCDHGVPADVSWANYVEYVGLLAEATGWK